MLADSLKVLLATSYAFAIKIQNFHWNVEGDNFPQYHKFFNDMYDEVFENCMGVCIAGCNATFNIRAIFRRPTAGHLAGCLPGCAAWRNRYGYQYGNGDH